MKYKYLFLLTFFILTEVLAADGLGRLFFTPEQRAQLDAARAKRDLRGPNTQAAKPAMQPDAPRGPETVTYNGAVRRSDGKSTVWINGKSITERNRITTPGDVNVLGMANDGAVSLAIPQAARTASLRVGQRLDVQSGRIEESYARRSTAVLQDEADRPSALVNTQPKIMGQVAPAIQNTMTRPKRTLRESHFKEADPDSGAAPAEPASRK